MKYGPNRCELFDTLTISLYLQMVKEKPNSTRIYDKDGFRRRAACICVRAENEDEVIVETLVRSMAQSQ